MSEQDSGDSGFSIQDRRSSYQSDEELHAADSNLEKEKAKQAAGDAQPAGAQESGEPYDIDFSTFVMSLASSAFYHLGDVPDPMTGQAEENLPAVRQTIDILLMLQAKTKSNLSPQEDKLLGQLVYELQMKYVSKTKK